MVEKCACLYFLLVFTVSTLLPPPNMNCIIIQGCSSPAALHGNLTVWMNLRFTKKKKKIKSTDFRWAVKHFSLATAGLRGFIWLCADSCRGEAFRLINCPHGVGERDGEKEWWWLSVPEFILPQRRLSCRPTRRPCCLFPLPPTLPPSLLCHWFAGCYLSAL